MRRPANSSYYRSLRLQGYDYAQAGAYFVTICTENRKCFLGEIVDGGMRLSAAGRRVEAEWQTIPQRFSGVVLDHFTVMPNHIHGIIMLPDNTTSPHSDMTQPVTPKLGEIIRAFKAAPSRLIRADSVPDFAWQRNYYEHVIRNEPELQKVREYIANNVSKWDLDRDNPARLEGGSHPR